ncbi:hypothetical protein M407DRAFT_243494 [Tulasnella calospora MUT 4182]|uniref:Uncharacterized protein n=1 Tax=Tulasnella calospora MUT 4182 TaxID=1051891 RepID=A0A0C3M068_9AGAM|nr:hypothetical protein M407DRAFT_243494 [Tulasnella calospora MUT 4182]
MVILHIPQHSSRKPDVRPKQNTRRGFRESAKAPEHRSVTSAISPIEDFRPVADDRTSTVPVHVFLGNETPEPLGLEGSSKTAAKRPLLIYPTSQPFRNRS